MDPRYHWPPQGYPNGQYAPPQPNGYPPNGYALPYPQQQMAPQYPPSQPIQGQPQVLVPPRPTQQYAQMHDPTRVQQRQPQVVIPARPTSSPMGQMHNPKIRQVQVTVPKTVQGQRPSNGVPPGATIHVQPRPPQGQTSVSKSVQRSQSHQENLSRPQQRTPSISSTNQNQHRSPLQPQLTPKQRTPSSQSLSNQQRNPSLPHTPSSLNRPHPQVVVKRTSQSAHTQSNPANAQSNALPADLSVLLLYAADEYINAAHNMGSLVTMAQRPADVQQYYKLMATGMGCMEAILKKHSQPPREEAKLRLRYASLLVEETDNDVEIEQVLSKGITLCQRNHLLDLKYAMQHLQARYQFKTNHRAALKSLDGPISETETFQHIVWVYAFRFLRVSLALQIPGRLEAASALQQLHAIANHAEKRGDRAIYVTASALEAMIHLRTAGPDHLEQAQRAIAAARTYQLQASTKELGQIAALIDTVDVACSLRQGQRAQQKLTILHQRADWETGPADGIFSVLIEKSFGGQSLTQHTGGVFSKAADGREQLVFSWLPAKSLQMLAYYLSAMTSLPHELSRGEEYLRAGANFTQDILQHDSSYAVSIPMSINQRSWVTVLQWHLRCTLGLMACYSGNLPEADRTMKFLQKRMTEPPLKDVDSFVRLASYLEGVIEQSKGSLDKALSLYALSQFSLPDSGAHGDLKTDIAIIANMNRILILRDPSHPEHFLMGVIFAQLEPLCTNHPNAFIDAGFRLIRALTTSDNSINRQKTLTSNAISAASKVDNWQFISMALAYMSSRFFAETVGEQALKSVRAARSMAKKSRSALWRAVAFGLCINSFRRNGLLQDAMDCQPAFDEIKDKLPASLIARLQAEATGTYLISDAYQDVHMQG